MQRMGIEALYRRPRTTKPEPGHKIYRYLLRDLEITRPNQVWAMDITYIPMARGFVYLAVVLDWFSRRVLSWRVSITMEAAFCVEALEDALACHGKPEILNTDQGSQFTGAAFTGVLIKNEIAVSMDGKGAWRDNVFVERLWRSVKYEEVYLRAYAGVSDARASIGRYLDFYNGRRPHSSLLLHQNPRDLEPWQVRRAEEYIEANWDDAMTVESIAEAVDASARSIFLSFRQARGYSPHGVPEKNTVAACTAKNARRHSGNHCDRRCA